MSVWYRAFIQAWFMVVTLGLFTGLSIAGETITFALEEYPPYISQHNYMQGIDAHIVSEAFRQEGLDVQFEFYPGARAYAFAIQGAVGGSFPWAKRESRLADFYFSDPLIEADQEHLYYLKDSNFKWDYKKQNYLELKGLRIGAVYAYHYGEKFEQAETDGVLTVDRTSELEHSFRKLLAGRVDLVISQKRTGDHTLRTLFSESDQGLISRQLENDDPTEYDYALFSKKNENSVELINTLNRGLQKIKDNGQYQKMLEDLENGRYSHP